MSRKDTHIENNIRDRLYVLMGLTEREEGEEIPKPHELADALTEIIYHAYDMQFRIGMMLGDLDLNREECKPPCVSEFEQALDDLDIRPL